MSKRSSTVVAAAADNDLLASAKQINFDGHKSALKPVDIDAYQSELRRANNEDRDQRRHGQRVENVEQQALYNASLLQQNAVLAAQAQAQAQAQANVAALLAQQSSAVAAAATPTADYSTYVPHILVLIAILLVVLIALLCFNVHQMRKGKGPAAARGASAEAAAEAAADEASFE
jgi:hypothetical protein